MRQHEFSLILTAEPTEEEAERLYALFDDGTVLTLEGVPQIHFHREAESLEEAIRSALQAVTEAGFVVRVKLAPEALVA